MKEQHEKKFIRFSEVENPPYIMKTIGKYVDDFDPKNDKEFWQITEKIHGSNVCVSNRYKEGPVFFSRNGNQLPPDYQEVMRQYNWEEYFRQNPDIHFVYGEIAGHKIQKGVDYGERAFYIFDIKDKDGNFIYPVISVLMSYDGMENYRPFKYAPIITYTTDTLEGILKLSKDIVENDLISYVNPKEGNIVEGVVIRCISRPRLTMKNRFIIKVKHPNFEEKVRKSSKKKKKKDDFDYSPVDPYVNENRAQSAMSKFPGYGRSKIGDVLREIVRDVEESMKKDGLKWEKQYCKYINKKLSKIVVEGADVQWEEKRQNLL